MRKLSDEDSTDDMEEEDSAADVIDPYDAAATGHEARVQIEEDGYTENWPAISAMKRAAVKYKCERCGIDLDKRRRLLQVHHIDHNRLNNEDWNLLAVCVLCHSTFPNHHHLLQRENKEDLEYLRALQSARTG